MKLPAHEIKQSLPFNVEVKISRAIHLLLPNACLALAETTLSLTLPQRFCPLIHFSFNRECLPSAEYILVIGLFLLLFLVRFK
jgi:hypothetical protein